jgi:hypothetical protein
MFDANDGHLVDAELLGRHHTSMPSHELVLLIDQHRADETELANAGHNLVDLLFGMGSCVARVKMQFVDTTVVDIERLDG